jgi:membrane protease YdiL (CAAX protease family)
VLRLNKITGAAYWVTDIVLFTGVPLTIVALSLRARWLTPADLGFTSTLNGQGNRFHFAVTLMTSPIFGFVAWLIAREIVYGLGLSWTPLIPFNREDYGRLLPVTSEPVARLIAVLYLAVSAGVVEELTFRAMLLRLLPPAWRSPVRYILISAVLFGAIHWWQGPASAVVATLFGVSHAWLYWHTRNVWVPAVSHAAVDLRLFSLLP